ncbi:protease inhibitor I42 family protein [soil metagenome]
MNRSFPAGVCTLSFLLFGCNWGGGENLSGALTEANSGDTISLSAGDSFTVRLRSNASTGYSWALFEAPPNLRQIGERQYIAARVAPGHVGAGGHEVWRFEAVSPGQGDLTLDYRRPWEEDEPPASSWDITVVVD